MVYSDSESTKLTNEKNTKSNLRHARSFNSLRDNRHYDFKIGFVPPNRQARKAKMVTFYKNGDSFSSASKVSIQPGKDFKTLSNLCDYLSQNQKLSQVVRYIFTLDGRRITDLRELQDGSSYVVSSIKHFQNLPYGKAQRLRTAAPVKSFAPVGFRDDDLKLLRPVKPEDKIHLRNRPPHRGSGSHSLPGEQDNRIIRVINNKEQGVQSRILLNLRTIQPFEELVGDLGDTVKMRNATRMLTSWQQEFLNWLSEGTSCFNRFLAASKWDLVRSFSQLKHELKDEDTFYVDNGMISRSDLKQSPPVTKYKGRRSNSAPKINEWEKEEERSTRLYNSRDSNHSKDSNNRRN